MVGLANEHNNPFLLYTIYKILIEYELVENSFKENTVTLEAKFFYAENLPELSFHGNTPGQINMCLEAKKFKVFETIFD